MIDAGFIFRTGDLDVGILGFVGIWVREPALGPGETVLWKRGANRTQSGARAVGGYLFLTGSRVLFEPNRVDAATGGRSWYAPLGAIRGVGVQQRDGSPFNGGLRNRLRLDLVGGGVELFVVNHVEEVVSDDQAGGRPACVVSAAAEAGTPSR